MTSEETEGEKRNLNRMNDIYNSDNQVDLGEVEENKKTNSHLQYKKKITPDGRIVRVLLSDGETSSGIESVSSVDGVDDATSDGMSSFVKNVLVEVKNEFALQYSEVSEQCDDDMDISYTPPSHEEDCDEMIYESVNSSEKQEHKVKDYKWDELRASSNRSDERISKKTKKVRKSRRSRSSRRWSYKRSNSPGTSRSVSRSRRKLPSRERRKLKISRKKRLRSVSRRRSRSLTRRRSRSLSRSGSLTRRRSRSWSRRRSGSLTRRRSRSWSRRRSGSFTRRSRSMSRKRSGSFTRRSRSMSRKRSGSFTRRSRSMSRKRSGSFTRRSRSMSRKRSRSITRKWLRSVSRGRSRSLTRRRSRSLSRRRSRSLTRRNSRMLRSSSRRSRSNDRVTSTSCERNERESVERTPAISYCSMTETRGGRGIRNFGYRSTTIQVASYFPPVFTPRYCWRGVNKYSRGLGRGVFYSGAKRHHSSISDEDPYPVSKHQKKPEIEYIKSVSPKSSPKDDSLKNEFKQDQSEISSEVSARSSPVEAEIFIDADDKLLPKTPDTISCGSSDGSKCHTPLPKFGLDNRPLVCGPTGLPVHITPTGVSIPYDMDGRRIPIGPNGHYLPLDESGRLFPHVIMDDNNAVPIYMSEDGVLRLPDSRPVPYDSHNYPVNVDGQLIYIGPDSRPLVPYPQIPTSRPIYINQAKNKQPPCEIVPKSEKESEELEPIEIIDNTGCEIVDLDMPDDLDEARSIDSNSKDSSNDTQTKLLDLESKADSLPNTSKDHGLKQIVRTADDDLLKKIQELAKQQDKVVKKKKTSGEDPVVMQIRSILKALEEGNYQPPQYARFIIPEVIFEPSEEERDMKFISPLLRNRIKLPFITPGAEESTPTTEESSETSIAYTFSSKENSNEHEETTPDEVEVEIVENSPEACICQNKPQTADFSAQCDFTTDTISEYNLTVSKLRKEVMSLQNAYSTLLEMYERVMLKNNSREKLE